MSCVFRLELWADERQRPSTSSGSRPLHRLLPTLQLEARQRHDRRRIVVITESPLFRAFLRKRLRTQYFKGVGLRTLRYADTIESHNM